VVNIAMPFAPPGVKADSEGLVFSFDPDPESADPKSVPL
jgi:hypothetical protein